jgi:hypothetical protein
MGYKAKAVAALNGAEKQLREIAGEALGQGDYGSVELITQWAKVLSDLQPPSPARIDRETVRTRPLPSSENSSSAAMAAAASRDAATFPRFERQAKRLVKLGWSERDKRIYEHRAPFEAVEEICRRFVEKAGTKRILKVDKILPIKTDDGEEIPSYQVYLVLKWLQLHGIVQKQGKDGYVIADPDFNLKSIWETTPAK